MNRRRFLTFAGANIAGLALVGCGSDGEETGRIEVTRIADVAGAPPTLAPNATPPSTSGGGQQAAAGGQQPAGGGQTHRVEMNAQLQFAPAELTLNVGDTVTWVTVGPIPHSATADPSKALNPEEHVVLPQGAEPWDSGLLNEGQEFSHTFEVPGEYTYFCIPHEAAGMIGYLTVQGEAQAGGATPPASPQGSPEATPVAGSQGGQGGQAGGGQPIQLEALDPAAWSQTQLNVSPGQMLVVTNVGVLEHTFAVDAWGIDQDLPNGEPVEIQVPQDAQPGQSFEFYCSVPGHRELGMVGTITVA